MFWVKQCWCELCLPPILFYLKQWASLSIFIYYMKINCRKGKNKKKAKEHMRQTTTSVKPKYKMMCRLGLSKGLIRIRCAYVRDRGGCMCMCMSIRVCTVIIKRPKHNPKVYICSFIRFSQHFRDLQNCLLPNEYILLHQPMAGSRSPLFR